MTYSVPEIFCFYFASACYIFWLLYLNELGKDKSFSYSNKREFNEEGFASKGQLISKCLFGVIVCTKIAMKILKGFLP